MKNNFQAVSDADLVISYKNGCFCKRQQKCFYKCIINKRRAKESFHPPFITYKGKYNERGYLIPSLPQSLIVRSVILRVSSPQAERQNWGPKWNPHSQRDEAPLLMKKSWQNWDCSAWSRKSSRGNLIAASQ